MVTQYFPLQIGQNILDRYQVEQELGMGGKGAVYRAFDTKLDRQVALKLEKVVLLNKGKSSLEDEFDILNRFECQGIPKVYDLHHLETDEKLLSMEFVEGKLLADILQDGIQLSLVEACSLLDQLASIVQNLHEKKIVHSDLKPENIMIGDSKSFKDLTVIDYGISIEQGSNSKQGTLSYMSPEHVRKKKITYKSDIYSLGIIFFKLLAGDFPYKDKDMFTHHSLRIAQFERIKELRPDLPSWITTVILTLTNRRPFLRYNTQQIRNLLKDRCPEAV